MKELTFNKEGDYYVTTFTVNHKFCLQMLRKAGGVFYIYLKLPEVEDYSPAEELKDKYFKEANIIYTFDVGMYPLDVKIASAPEVIKAYVVEEEA